jgi:uncharacterized protein
MLKEKEIQNIINKIKHKIHPSKIYLFGSYANGNPKPNSDLDLLVIANIKNKRKTFINLKKDLISKDFSLDLLLYTEKEYNDKKQAGWKVFEEIERTGIEYT